MENTVTLSQLADLIIVVGSISLAFSVLVYLIADIIFDLIDLVRNRREARKERQAQEPEQAEQT